ncbi:MAG TPA: hypothetical protein VJ783_10985 [Pirellulales bacterium]|nr:hypothetical protein [Pirellulales bacterium]
MAMTFDATLKDMGRDSPQGFLAAFDRPPSAPVKLLNVDLSTVTAAADLVLGIGEPLEEIVHLDFQSGEERGRSSLLKPQLVVEPSCVQFPTAIPSRSRFLVQLPPIDGAAGR